MYIYLEKYTLSLSLYIYIYIYTHPHTHIYIYTYFIYVNSRTLYIRMCSSIFVYAYLIFKRDQGILPYSIDNYLRVGVISGNVFDISNFVVDESMSVQIRRNPSNKIPRCKINYLFELLPNYQMIKKVL